MPNLIKQLRDKYETLPDELKDALYSVELTNKVLHTAHVYGADDRAPLIGDLIGMRMLGVLPEQKYKAYMREGLKTVEKFDEFYEKIENQVFDPLRPILKRVYAGETATASSPPRKPPEPERRKEWVRPIPPRPFGARLAPPSGGAAPLDLRKIQREREDAALAQEPDFPGEIVHHGEEEMKAFDDFSPPSREEKREERKELPKPEPSKRYTPPEKDTYLEPVEEEPQKLREGNVVDLSKD